MNDKMLDALSSAIFVSRATLTGEAIDTDDKKIRASGLYPEWVEGKHAKGEIYNTEGQTWECFQAYDNATYPDIRPDSPVICTRAGFARYVPSWGIHGVD